jgi:uncharacterized membrane protein YgdD (TMEM256/DUF423 family)
MKIKTIRVAGLSGMAAVLFGAFGAHGLSFLLEPSQLETYKTGVLYHFIHTLAILIIGFSGQTGKRSFNFASLFFGLGIILFSGSLYLLSCQNILGIEHWKFLGPVTPIGGLFFVLGWLSLVFISTRNSQPNPYS